MRKGVNEYIKKVDKEISSKIIIPKNIDQRPDSQRDDDDYVEPEIERKYEYGETIGDNIARVNLSSLPINSK